MLKDIILYIAFIVASVVLASLAVYYRYLYITRNVEKEAAKKTESVSETDTDSKEKKDEQNTESEQKNQSEADEKEHFSGEAANFVDTASKINEKLEISKQEESEKGPAVRKLGFKEILSNSKIFFAVCAACYICVAVLGLIFREAKDLSVLSLAQYVLLWDLMFLTASIDIKIKKIPNLLILVMLAVRALGIIGEIICYPSFWSTFVLSSVVGMLVGGLFVLICYFISRGGIGVGDLKMFATIGFFFGLSGVMEIMMYSLFLACIVSIFLLISRKAKFKSSVPMAPFVFIGLSVYFIFL